MNTTTGQMNGPAYNATSMGTAVQEARPISFLEEREVQLAKATVILNETIERLHQKIQHTLLPEAPSKGDACGGIPVEIHSPAAQFLSIQEQEIRNATRWLENIMGRCEL